MSLWESILLGVVQGLTEFLPVSSSGHLELMHRLLGVSGADNLSFDMVVHAATVLSTIVVFWGEIVRLLRGVLRWQMNDETVFVLNILISMLPVAFVGLFFKDTIESLFTGNLVLVGCMLLVTAALLAFSHFARPRTRPLTPQSAFAIGIAQAVAVLPGLSRSGATISAGLLQGVRREEAARFSFLMVLIPVIGINFLELLKGDLGGALPAPVLLAGFLAAFATGTLACRWMIDIVKKGKLIWFAAYCVVAGVAAIILN